MTHVRTEDYSMDVLDQLEAESIHILRETAACFEKPVMLYSIGKDSSVLLHLARKAFHPGSIPFPLLHIDTKFKFPEMIAFRNYFTKKIGANLLVHTNTSPEAQGLGPQDAHTDHYIYLKKTKPLLDAIAHHGFTAAIGGARREEEKSRAKERIFSIRSSSGGWNPKAQRPEVWHLYNTELAGDQTMRVFPLSNWTEVDIWAYILRENIEVVPLYFAEEREVVRRHGMYIRVDEFTQPAEGEAVERVVCRYRTLGCAPSTGAVPSPAQTIAEILEEVAAARLSERVNRAIDYTSSASMEKKKKEGYF